MKFIACSTFYCEVAVKHNLPLELVMKFKLPLLQKFVNVLQVFDFIQCVLSTFRARGYSVTATNQAETHLRNYLKLFLYYSLLLWFVYNAITKKYSTTGFLLFDSGINVAMIFVSICGVLLELRYFSHCFLCWQIALKFHEFDLLVNIFYYFKFF